MPTLVEKLASIAKTVPQIPKEGHNGVYPYLRAVDVFDTVRLKLFEEGILIFPVSQTVTRSTPYHAISGDITDEVITEVHYEIRGWGETIPCCACGVGQDHEGKALYMASTGAKKDLLKTILLLAGVEDDTEGVQDTGRVAPDLASKITEMETKCGPDIREWPVGIQGAIAWNSACRTSGLHENAKKAFLKKMGLKNPSEIKRKDFDMALGWALGKMEVSLGEASSSTDDESVE